MYFWPKSSTMTLRSCLPVLILFFGVLHAQDRLAYIDRYKEMVIGMDCQITGAGIGFEDSLG